MRHLMALIMAVLVLAGASPASSDWGNAGGGAVSIEVVSDRGRGFQSVPHKEFWRDGTRTLKGYLEAVKGENYEIVIRNLTSERLGLVIAVDGRNIITGKSSNLKNSERMYILNAYELARYSGWRTSGDTVNKFYFTDTSDSYAVKTFDDSSAMGVIAVAVYKEKPRPVTFHENRLQKNAPAPAAAGRARAYDKAEESDGTGFGDAQYSPVITVSFEPEARPIQKTLLKYEWREVLCKKGILHCGRNYGNRLWDNDGYAPYPPR